MARSQSERDANCPKGHAWTTENTYWHTTRKCRVCRTCTKKRLKRPEVRKRHNSLAAAAARTPKGKMRSLTNRLKLLYNMTLAQYLVLALHQGGKCAVCRSQFNLDDKKAINIDHDHATDQVRGLLCNRCNVGIGMLREDPAVFANALTYLKATTNHFRKALLLCWP